MANTTVQSKRTTVPGRIPTTGQISQGEFGINMTDQIAYSSNGSVVFAIGNNLPTQHVNTNLYVGNSTVNCAINTTAIVGVNIFGAQSVIGL